MSAAETRQESRLQKAVTAYFLTGLAFMLLPGTFLGVWNLISISNRRELDSLSAAWLQAHGHAQIFGWLGTFVLGIGFYSLSKMGSPLTQAVPRAWLCYALWTAGVALRWMSNVTGWQWRLALPLSAVLELAGFLIFFATVSRHKAEPSAAPRAREAWMLVVVASTFGFLVALSLNLLVVCDASWRGVGPAIARSLDQRLLVVPAWGFLVPAVWGFNGRWLPIFFGLRAPRGRLLLAAVAFLWLGIIAALMGQSLVAAAFLLAGSLLAAVGLQVFRFSTKPAAFIRAAYVWLLVAGVLTSWAAAADRFGGIWGASRHALTVGFLAAMVFSIGPRILPAFCGARQLFSSHLMLASLLLLNFGCALRVASEIPAYEGFVFAQQAWRVLPFSALMELFAVSLFAVNLLLTFLSPAALLREQRAVA